MLSEQRRESKKVRVEWCRTVDFTDKVATGSTQKSHIRPLKQMTITQSHAKISHPQFLPRLIPLVRGVYQLYI